MYEAANTSVSTRNKGAGDSGKYNESRYPKKKQTSMTSRIFRLDL